MAHLKPPSSSKAPSSPKKSNPNPNPNPSPKSSIKSKSTMSSKGEQGGKRVVFGALQREKEDDDSVTILTAVADFKARTGNAPTPATMSPVLDAIKGKLHHGDINVDQLYNKFRSLKQRYYRCIDSGVGPSSFDRAFFDLSVKAWGEPKRKNSQPIKQIDEGIKSNSSSRKRKEVEEIKEEDEDDDDEEEEEEDDEPKDEKKVESRGDVSKFKYLRDQATKYWKTHGWSMADLELGLKFMDKSKAEVLEAKWKSFFEADLRVEAKNHEVQRDVITALAAAGQKG